MIFLLTLLMGAKCPNLNPDDIFMGLFTDLQVTAAGRVSADGEIVLMIEATDNNDKMSISDVMLSGDEGDCMTGRLIVDILNYDEPRLINFWTSPAPARQEFRILPITNINGIKVSLRPLHCNIEGSVVTCE
jgi:hypothetical protein